MPNKATIHGCKVSAPAVHKLLFVCAGVASRGVAGLGNVCRAHDALHASRVGTADGALQGFPIHFLSSVVCFSKAVVYDSTTGTAWSVRQSTHSRISTPVSSRYECHVHLNVLLYPEIELQNAKCHNRITIFGSMPQAMVQGCFSTIHQVVSYCFISF